MGRFGDMETPEQAYARQVAEGTYPTAAQLRAQARTINARAKKTAKADPKQAGRAADLADEAARLRKRAKNVPAAEPAPEPKRGLFGRRTRGGS